MKEGPLLGITQHPRGLLSCTEEKPVTNPEMWRFYNIAGAEA